VLAARRTVSVLACAVALVLAGAPAFALLVTSTDGFDTVFIESDADGDVMVMTCADGEASVAGAAVAPDLGCADVGSVLVDAGGGIDTVDLGAVTQAAFPSLRRTSIDVADTSADTVVGSGARDEVSADSLDDVSTGAGDDWVEGARSASGGDGDDTLRDISGSVDGGPGDDLIYNPGTGPLTGGSGQDTVVLDYSAFTMQLTVSLSVTDRSLGGVEATSGIEEYDVTASDGVRADTVDSREYSGRVVFHGRAGEDIFVGGPGSDVADGGSGNDTLDPGAGADLVLAGDGDDTIAVRDGVSDIVDCGAGNDTVTADRLDVLTGCESVSLPAPETGPILGPKKVTKGEKPVFSFASSASGAAFQCAIDAGPYMACASPYTVKTRRLRPGRHTLSVRAVQPADNADPSPSTFRFKVKAKKVRKARHT
jgi:Ca2+-binding RTX toxin-like protein